MSTKLTLRLDAVLIDQAKTYAHEQDRSLSQLVADYFARLTVAPQAAATARVPKASTGSRFGPITTGLRGALRQPSGSAKLKKAAVSRRDYRAHLEEKYL